MICERNIMKFGPFEGIMENTSCPLCKKISAKNNTRHLKNAATKLIFKNREGIGFHKCLRCSSMFASPRFTEDSMLKIYENEAFADLSMYEKWSYEDWKQSSSRSYNVSLQKVLLIKKYLPEGSRILDVGCAAGDTVLEANKNGFLCEGIEPSSRLSDIARNALKVPVTTTHVENFQPPYKFKGIIVWDVLEHLYDPIRVVRRCADLLETGGFLFAQTPNYKGISNTYKTLLCRLGLRTLFKHFGFPWHVYSFDKKSLSFLMDSAGLGPIHFESWSHLLKEGRRDAFSQTAIDIIKKLCLSDYLVCVAQKS